MSRARAPSPSPLSARAEAECRSAIALLVSRDPAEQATGARAVAAAAAQSPQLSQLAVASGAGPALADVLGRGVAADCQSAALAVGTLARASAECQATLIAQRVLPPLLARLEGGDADTERAAWAVRWLCRGCSDPAALRELRAAPAPLARVLLASEAAGVLTEACWALAYLCDGPDDQIQAVVDERGVCAKCVELLAHPRLALQAAALACVSNIVSGSEAQTEAAIAVGALPALIRLVPAGGAVPAVQKEACFALANVGAGSAAQVGRLVASGALPPLLALLEPAWTLANAEAQAEAAWAVANMASNGEALHLEALGELGGPRRAWSLLTTLDPPALPAVAPPLLQLLLAFRRTRQATPPTAAAAAALERLGTHADTQVASRARRLARFARPSRLVDAGAAVLARLSVAVKGVVDRADGVTEYLIVSTIHNRSVAQIREEAAAAAARPRSPAADAAAATVAAAGEAPVNLRASLVGWSKNLPLAAAPRPSTANGGGGGGVRVDVSHRFSDFLKLHAKLQPQLPQLPPAFPLGRTPFVSDGVKKERAAVLALYLQAAVAACAATAEPADADRCADELCAFLGVGQDAARALEPATPPRARDLSISSSPRSSVSATPPRPASLNDLTAATPTPPAAKVVAPAVSAAAPASAERCGWRCLRCVQT